MTLLPQRLLELHRAAAQATSLRAALDATADALRTALDAAWVVAVVWEPMARGVRCSAVSGPDEKTSVLLLRAVADLQDVDLTTGVVTAGSLPTLLQSGGCDRGAIVVVQPLDQEVTGLLVAGLGATTPTDAHLAEVQRSVTVEIGRASRAERDQRRALYDAATGLPGPLLLDAVVQAADPAQEVALLLVSVDQLQSVLRSFGRAAGNEMLRKVAARLLVAGGAGAWSAYRLPRGLGVLTVGEAGTAASAADTILAAMQEPWLLGRRSVRSTCRIGLVRSDGNRSADVLIERAESALDAALASPRGGVIEYGPQLAANAHQNLVLETLLQAALASGELHVRYQPQVDVRTGRVCGAEALVRWHRPSGMVTPDRFIPAAEASGVIVDIDRWVLKEACRQAQQWVDEGRQPLRMACNISSLTLAAPGFADAVLAELAISGLAPDQLEVEITETLSLFEGDEAVRELMVLREHGVHVAIDDFGTGYSNVSRLRDLPVDRVKIDQSFVRDIAVGADTDTDGGDGGAICSVIVDLARTLHLDVIAEGVETAEQLSFLGRLGCAEFQGYLVSPPVEAADFELLLS